MRALAFVFLFALVSCGSKNVPCPNCAGCCENGQCVDGTDPAACGQGGVACVACSGTLVCNPITNGGGSCGVDCQATCNGCCDGAVCELGTSNALCGAYGLLCVSCPGTMQCTPNSDSGGQCQ